MSIPHPTLWTGACILALSAAASLAAPPIPARKAGYEGYALVQMRNIFDPERIPGVINTPEVVSTPTPTAADYAALTGTMLTADKTLAFFSGSRPEFNKVLTIGGSISGATLRQINASSIEVEREGKRIAIAIGQTVPLNASSAPGIAPTPSITTSSSLLSTPPLSSPTTSITPSTSAAPTPGSSDREALLRRMMEKRQQELK